MWTCARCGKILPNHQDIYQCWAAHLPDVMEKYGFTAGDIVCLKGCSEILEVEQLKITAAFRMTNAEHPKIHLFTDIFTNHDIMMEEEREKVLDEILRELSGDGVVGVRQEGSTLIIERDTTFGGTGFEWDDKAVRVWNRLSLKVGFLQDVARSVVETIFTPKVQIAAILTFWITFWLVAVPVTSYYVGYHW